MSDDDGDAFTQYRALFKHTIYKYQLQYSFFSSHPSNAAHHYFVCDAKQCLFTFAFALSSLCSHFFSLCVALFALLTRTANGLFVSRIDNNETGRIFWVCYFWILYKFQMNDYHFQLGWWLLSSCLMHFNRFFFVLLENMASCDNCSSLRLAHFFHLDFIYVINTIWPAFRWWKKIILPAIKQTTDFFFLPRNENCVIELVQRLKPTFLNYTNGHTWLMIQIKMGKKNRFRFFFASCQHVFMSFFFANVWCHSFVAMGVANLRSTDT